MWTGALKQEDTGLSRSEKDLGKAFGIRKNETVQTGDSGNPSNSLRSLCSFDVKKHKRERVRESCTIELSNVGRCSVIKTQTEKTVTSKKYRKQVIKLDPRCSALLVSPRGIFHFVHLFLFLCMCVKFDFWQFHVCLSFTSLLAPAHSHPSLLFLN